MKRLMVWVTIACSLSGLPIARAALTETQQASLRRSVKFVNSAKTFGELIARLQVKMTPADYKDFVKAMKGAESRPNLKVAMVDDDAIQIQSDKTAINMKFVSFDPEVMVVNGKTVDLSEAKTLEERMDLIYAALPKMKGSSSDSAMWRILVPQAHAFLPLIAGLGYVGWGMIATTGLGAVVGTVTKNDELCKEMGEALNGCIRETADVNQWSRKQDKSIDKALKEKRKKDDKKKKEEEDLVNCQNEAKKKNKGNALKKALAKCKPKKKDDDDDEDGDKKQKTDEEEDALGDDDDAKAWRDIKNLRQQNGDTKACPAISPNDDIDKEAADALGAINNLTDRWLPRLAVCGDGRLHKMQACAETLKAAGEATCLHRTVSVGKKIPSVHDTQRGGAGQQ